MKKVVLLVVAVLFVSTLAADAAMFGPNATSAIPIIGRYELTELPFEAVDINNAGVVIGYLPWLNTYYPDPTEVFYYENGETKSLGRFGFSSKFDLFPVTINDRKEILLIVANGQYSPGGSRLWDNYLAQIDGSLKKITLDGFEGGNLMCSGLNNHGQVSGTIRNDAETQSFIWMNEGPHKKSQLVLQAEGFLYLGSINNAGQTIGHSWDTVFCNNGLITELKRPNRAGAGFGYGYAYDINDNGLIVGHVYYHLSGPGYQHLAYPIFWQGPDGDCRELKTSKVLDHGYAYDVNNAGMIVGQLTKGHTWDEETKSAKAVVWPTIHSAPVPLPGGGWSAFKINERGQILCYRSTTSVGRWFLLTPRR